MSDGILRPQAVIFDYGYVLQYPTDPAGFQRSMETLAREVGFQRGQELWNHVYASDAWERAKRGQMTEGQFWADRLAEFGIAGAEAALAFRARLLAYADGIHPDMRRLLYDLRPKVRLAVLSNTAVRDMARWFEEKHGLKDVFEVVVGSADVGIAKPEPEIYRLVLERLGLPPGEALFVDDMPRNVEAAEALGLPAILFTTPDALRTDLVARGLLD